MATSTSSAAHKCFSIAELTSRIIADNIYEHDDLLHVALSCRAFLEPALDSLWCELNTLLPLLHLFPEDVFSYERNIPKVSLRLCQAIDEAHSELGSSNERL
jgi:hypothetical protein